MHHNKHAIPLTLISIDPGGCHLMLHATINGYKANVLIDTGASTTVMDMARADKYLHEPDINPYDNHFTGMGAGQIKAWVTNLSHLTIGDIQLHDLQILLIDMTPVQRSYARFDLPRIDMVMGGDLLLQLGAVIDYPNKVLLVGA